MFRYGTITYTDWLQLWIVWDFWNRRTILDLQSPSNRSTYPYYSINVHRLLDDMTWEMSIDAVICGCVLMQVDGYKLYNELKKIKRNHTNLKNHFFLVSIGVTVSLTTINWSLIKSQRSELARWYDLSGVNWCCCLWLCVDAG